MKEVPLGGVLLHTVKPQTWVDDSGINTVESIVDLVHLIVCQLYSLVKKLAVGLYLLGRIAAHDSLSHTGQ